jgi:hypothetical protein
MATGDDILAMKQACEKQVPYERTDCPVCAWPIEKVKDVLHCPFCGWTS